MTPNLVLGASAISSVSGELAGNLKSLLSGDPVVVPGNVFLGPHEVEIHGRIPDAEIEALVRGFEIAPKAGKFFDRPSALTFACLSKLRGLLVAPPEDTALFAATGPTNARLDIFTGWKATHSEGEAFPPMMASETVKLLPNLLMSNLSMNLGMKGENAIFCGGPQAGAAALEAALGILGSPGARLAAVVSVSSPLEYFNVDAYRRFMPRGTGSAHLVDAASALILAPVPVGPRERHAAGVKNDPSGRPLGTILRIRRFKIPEPGKVKNALEAAGYSNVDHGFSAVVVQPSAFGETLSAAEPFGCLAAMSAIEGKGPCVKGVSICIDPFGNGSSIEVAGPDFFTSGGIV